MISFIRMRNKLFHNLKTLILCITENPNAIGVLTQNVADVQNNIKHISSLEEA